MTALKKRAAHPAPINPPPGLPPFASFALSHPSEPIPAMEPGEEVLLSPSMVPTRRTAIVRGRAAAHAALRAINLNHGPILTGDDRQPLWPEGVMGAISHAAGYAVALVAPAADTDGVGIDLEQHRDIPELSDHVPRPEERKWLAGLDVTDREAALLGLFSAKESVFKAFYPRIRSFFGFQQASLTPTASGFTGRLTGGLDDAYPQERSFEITCVWQGDLVLTSVVLPKTSDVADGGQ